MKKLFTVTLFLLGRVIPITAESYFIAKNTSGNNDGSSWHNAWSSVADINWSQINPGDTIFISGGMDSTVYDETLVIKSDGTIDRPVVISRGIVPGHDGKAIFDGKMEKADGIIIDNHNYLIVKGLQVRNYIGSGQIMIRHSTRVLIENNEIYVTGHGGIYIRSCMNVIIKNNRISTPDVIAAQTDGIYSQLNKNNIYERNRIIINNKDTAGHNDGIQLYQDSDIILRNNYIEQNNDKEVNAQGIYITDSFGTITVYNNVVYCPNTWNGLLVLRNISEGNAALLAFHNTVIGGGWGTLRIDHSPNTIIRNNILVCYQQNGVVIRIDGQITDRNNIDFNLYFAPNSATIAEYNGIGTTWLEWKNLGFEKNGQNQDPRFKNASRRDFSLEATSPAIDNGIELDSQYLNDNNDVSRPQGQGWDIGAYEYISLSPPQNVRIRLSK